MDDVFESVSQVRPWVRYWARIIDIFVVALIFGFIIGLVEELSSSSTGILELPNAVLNIIVIVLVPFVEAIFISNWGATPGKMLLKTKVLNVNGQYPSYMEALIRSFRVAWQGLGLGIPIVSWVTLLISYSNLKNDSITSWDANLETVVIHKKIGVTRTIISLIVIIAFFGLIIW
jgi:uncharacterized RDD family membrane protein YckC